VLYHPPAHLTYVSTGHIFTTYSYPCVFVTVHRHGFLPLRKGKARTDTPTGLSHSSTRSHQFYGLIPNDGRAIEPSMGMPTSVAVRSHSTDCLPPRGDRARGSSNQPGLGSRHPKQRTIFRRGIRIQAVGKPLYVTPHFHHICVFQARAKTQGVDKGPRRSLLDVSFAISSTHSLWPDGISLFRPTSRKSHTIRTHCTSSPDHLDSDTSIRCPSMSLTRSA
jgi:hypothetical protein